MQGTGGYAVRASQAGFVLAEETHTYPVRVHYACAAVGSDETKQLLRVKKGERVVAVALRQGVSAAGGSSATWTIGDSTTHDGYLASTSCVQTAGTLVDGAGTYLINNAGKLYTTKDSVNLYYTAGVGAGATAPTCDVRLVIQQEWPEV